MLDTHKAITELVNCKLTQEQAEGVVKLIQETNQIMFNQLATKNDFNHLKESIDSLKWLITIGLGVITVMLALLK